MRLAAKYGVSRSVIETDIKFLKEELGVPIVATKGNKGGSCIYYSYANIKHLKKSQAEALIDLIKRYDENSAAVITKEHIDAIIGIIDDFWSPLIAKELKEKYK